MTLRRPVQAWVLLVLLGVGAATSSKAQSIESVPEQRHRLATERDDALRYFDTQDAQCKSQFAVTGCLKDVNRQRLIRLAAIKKAENRLQDLERFQRGVEQRQQLEDRAAERERQTQELIGATSTDEQPRRTSEKNTAESPSAQARLDKSAVVSSSPKAAINDVQQRDNRNAYEAKQLEAQKKRVERDKRLREQKLPMQGLPPAPLSSP